MTLFPPPIVHYARPRRNSQTRRVGASVRKWDREGHRPPQAALRRTPCGPYTESAYRDTDSQTRRRAETQRTTHTPRTPSPTHRVQQTDTTHPPPSCTPFPSDHPDAKRQRARKARSRESRLAHTPRRSVHTHTDTSRRWSRRAVHPSRTSCVDPVARVLRCSDGASSCPHRRRTILWRPSRPRVAVSCEAVGNGIW